MSGDLWATVPQPLMWLGVYYPSPDCGLTNTRGNWSLVITAIQLPVAGICLKTLADICVEAGANDTLSRPCSVMSWETWDYHEVMKPLLSQFMSSRVKHRESIKILVRSDFIQQLCSFSPDDRRAHNASLVSTSDKESAEENMILSSLFFRSDSV